ncbi:recombinase RecT [Kitasatospora sp. NPDC048239]|uniref:recombinase RecT n=1 Tax=Kitasatospora sp. NPDC048239 TaxID=3364046 RepID=UPI00370FBA85
MTAQTVSNAIAVRDTGPAAIIEQYKGELATVMPSHVKPDTFARLAVSVLRRDDKLMKAAANNPAALMGALMEAARLGLEPGTEQYYLTPRYNGKTRQEEIAGIRGYQGEIELIYRAGAVSSVIVEVVRFGDIFRYRPGRDERPDHEIDWDAEDRGELRLVYAYAVMKDGATSKVVVLNRAQVAKARAMSKGSDSQYSPWQQHEEAMWLKTAAHRLTKWVPTSAEYMREQLRAKVEVAAERPAASIPVSVSMPMPPEEEPVEGEFVDAEPVEWPSVAVPGGAR